VALVFIGGYRRVRADDFLGLTGDGGCKGDVLADGEAEDVGFAGELEAVAMCISSAPCFQMRARTWRCCEIGQSSPLARILGIRWR
jgi:hypothetical protein